MEEGFVAEAVEFVGVAPDFGVERDLGCWDAETGSFGEGEAVGEGEVGAHYAVDGCCSRVSDLFTQTSTVGWVVLLELAGLRRWDSLKKLSWCRC